MRYKPDQKERTHAKMRLAASHAFRRGGFAGTGVDALAREAEVTSGAFYSHFGSKSAAFDAAVTVGLDEVLEAIPAFRKANGPRWAHAFAEYYLSPNHRADLSAGCAMTTLTPEVVRSRPETKALYEKKMSEIVDLLADGLRSGTLDERRNRGWAFLSMLIGGLHLSRAVGDNGVSDKIAACTIASALRVLGSTRGGDTHSTKLR